VFSTFGGKPGLLFITVLYIVLYHLKLTGFWGKLVEIILDLCL